jgi:hypothetical protein
MSLRPNTLSCIALLLLVHYSHLCLYKETRLFSQSVSLTSALYDLKQAPRAWFAKFSSTISQHGFSASSYNSTLFFRRSDHGITLLLLYVDDMIITGDDVQGIQDLKRFLGQHFEMKDLSPLSYFLGLEVSSSSDGYYLTQAKYTSNLIS